VRLVCVLLAAACAAPKQPSPAQPPPELKAAPAGPPDQATLVFWSSVAGQIVPCGCSPDQRGGLPRAVAYVDQLRKTTPNVLFVDAGDLLFETPAKPNAQALTQKQLKARTLARGDELLQAAARAVGQRDLALGAGFAAETAGRVPLLDAGVGPVAGTRETLLVNAGPVKVGLFAAGFEADVPAAMAARVRALREQGARLIVLLLHPRGANAFPAAQALLPAAKAAGVDLLVLGRRDDPAGDPNARDPGAPPLFAVEGHGQSMLRLDVHLGEGPPALAPTAQDRDQELKALDARIDRFRAQLAGAPQRRQQLEAKIQELEERKRAILAAPLPQPPAGSSWVKASFVPLTNEVGSDADAQKLVDAYDQRVAELNLQEAQKQPEACLPPAPGELSFLGVAACAECHEEASQFWAETKHAHAYDTLVGVTKQFSLDCIQCHVTGWQQPGGVCRIDRTQLGGPGVAGRGVGRRDVQCEDCHGPGSAHVKDATGGGIQREVPAVACMRCHELANSPHFDDVKYRPYIVGPGHGEPLAKGQKPHPRPGGPHHE